MNILISFGYEFNNKVFSDGETLIAEKEISYANFSIQIGQGVCNTISTNSTSAGSSVNIASGIYFVRGIFARVASQRILLDQYSTNPSYKVGFNVIESIVTSDEDESLVDNAQGFSNYASPGADRFKIQLELTKKGIDEEVDNKKEEVDNKEEVEKNNPIIKCVCGIKLKLLSSKCKTHLNSKAHVKFIENQTNST